MPTAYRILDEPRPGALVRLAVNPLWPLLAVMFAGAWLAWPWFAVNGFACGSPTRGREATLAAGGFVGSAAVYVALLRAADAGWLGAAAIPYALVALVVWKLLVSYWLYALQARIFGLFEYFHGATRNGMIVVVAAALLRRRLYDLLEALAPFDTFLRAVLL